MRDGEAAIRVSASPLPEASRRCASATSMVSIDASSRTASRGPCCAHTSDVTVTPTRARPSWTLRCRPRPKVSPRGLGLARDSSEGRKRHLMANALGLHLTALTRVASVRHRAAAMGTNDRFGRLSKDLDGNRGASEGYGSGWPRPPTGTPGHHRDAQEDVDMSAFEWSSLL